MNGQMMRCAGTGKVRIRTSEGAEVDVNVLVVHERPLGFEFILGMNALTALGGVK